MSTQTRLSRGRLSPGQVDRFYDQGFLRLDDVLTPDDLNPVIWEYEGIIDRRARPLLAEGKIRSLYEREPFDRRIACIAAEAAEVADKLNSMFTRGPCLFNFMRHPKILDVAESLVGPEITFHPTHQFRPRIPDPVMGAHKYSGSYSGWHQDAGVFQPEADNQLILTVWIPLNAATVENGCLVVLPGSHKHGLRRHQPSPTPPVLFIPPDEMPPGEPLPLPIQAGGLILFHNYTCHASLPNNSDRVRWSTDQRYLDTAKPTGHPYYPGFVARSRVNPASELTYPEWVSMWERQQVDLPRPPAWRWK